LIGIGNHVIGLLDQRLSLDSAPREMKEVDLPELALVNGSGMDARSRCDLMADGNDGVESLLSGDVSVRNLRVQH
jgi:hypothetical protein